MKKHLLVSLAILAAVAWTSTSTTYAQTSESKRLYEEFLEALKEQQNTYAEPNAGAQPAPVVTQPKVQTNDYTVSGKVTRTADGRYLVTTDESPARILRVYGQEAAKEIMTSTLYTKVQLIGQKAYFNGKLVGISAQRVVVLEAEPVKTAVQKPVSQKPVVQKPATSWSETTFYGTIELTSAGAPYLVMWDANNKRVTHRLLNETEWKIAFQHAYKGNVTVRGYMTEKGAIRYSSIY